MLPHEVRAARVRLGLSPRQFAIVMDTDTQSIRRFEMEPEHSTARKLPARAARLIKAYLAGYRPADWPD